MDLTHYLNELVKRMLLKRVALVNGYRLEKNCRRKLKYSDKIALLGKVRPRRGLNTPGIKHESLNGFFLFKEGYRPIERQNAEDPSMTGDEDSVEFTPGQNHLILSHIFSYLTFNTLKRARLVCTKWDEEAVRILKKKSTVSFNFRDLYEGPIQPMRLLRYIKEMKNLQLPSLTLDLPPFTAVNNPDPQEAELLLKLADDLTWFLSDRGSHITRLNLEGRIFSRSDYKIHLGILIKLQATLCDLELSWNFDLRDESSQDYAFPTEDLHLNKLEAFTFSVRFGRTPPVITQRTIISSWAAAVQGVKTFQVNYCEQEFLTCLLRYEQPFPKLEAFTTRSTQQIVLDLLFKLTNPLKMLILNNLGRLEPENFARLENLLLKHADTLEDLQFMDDVSHHGQVLHLPVLPRLKRLSVGCVQFSDLKIRFPSAQDNKDVVDYERHLPRLDALSLYMFPCSSYALPDVWKVEGDKLENFFPTRDRNGAPIETRCVTLRKLDPRVYVPGHSWQPVEFHPDFPLTRMFPNVWNEWMTKRRREESLSRTRNDMEANSEPGQG
ncbi:hypothetical protein Fcan01_24616 [Folsomia candida]|uniref:F-box domain-containing protein n=1 Tax=Folsomia candida TaxID=158441 RepID=A0A226D5F0_FOLCA|nr:hypothetical protein Fcan01_24616 [Folsomia candida]